MAVDQRDYLEGKCDTSARDYFFYYTGPTPSAVRYKNWKLYYAMDGADGTGGLLGPVVRASVEEALDNGHRDFDDLDELEGLV